MNFLESVGLLAILVVVWLFGLTQTKVRFGGRLQGLLIILTVYTIISIFSSMGKGISNLFKASTATPISTSIRTPRPQLSTTSTGKPCLRWNEIRSSMNGQTVCVYGIVQAIYPTNETWTRIRFTDQPNNFFMFSQLFIFPDLSAGDCVQANGKVQLYESIPYIESDDLYRCEAWMK